MKNNRLVSVIVACALLLLVLFSMGACSQQRKSSPPPAELHQIHRVVIFPFKNQTALKGENVVTQCSVCGSVFTTGNVVKDATDYITRKATLLIDQKETLTLVPNDRFEAVQIELQLDTKTKGVSQAELWGIIGEKLGADAVVSGNVYRFKQRIGTSLAADEPASVGFDIYMISAPGGQLLWHARFDESQQSLFENLLKINTFVKQKGKWLTAEELAEYGLKKVLERFPLP